MTQGVVKSIGKYVRISPIKARFVANLIRNKDVNQAEAILNFTPKKAAKSIKKVLLSAINDAKVHKKIEKENLYVKEIYVNKAPTWKRWMPRARGIATRINKPTSHITLILGEKEKNKEEVKK